LAKYLLWVTCGRLGFLNLHKITEKSDFLGKASSMIFTNMMR
jgi:hypothetical protein